MSTTVAAKRHQYRHRRGFGLLDVMMAIGASSLVYAGMAQMQNDWRQSKDAVTMAHQMSSISEASKRYVQKNYIKLQGLIPAYKAIEIPLSDNQNWNSIGDVSYGSGLLSQSFSPILSNGQQVHLLTYHYPRNGNMPDHLESMLITTGSPMNDRQIGEAMNAMEGNGGGIMRKPPRGIPSNTIQGSFGSWAQTSGNWASSGVPITYGHIAYSMDTIGAPISDYLNRYNTGDPEANTLHNHIDFNGNSADNVSNLDVMTINNTRADNVQFNTSVIGNSKLRQTGLDNAVLFKSGINLCQNNATGCGISVSDDGGFFDLNDGWITVINSYNQGLAIQNNLKVGGRIGSVGYAPGQGDPSGWGGGLTTWDIVSHGTIAGGVDDNGVPNVYVGSYINSQHHGTVQASESVSAQIIRPTYVVSAEGDPCNITAAGAFGNHAQFSIQNGDIARDNAGLSMVCVDGKWKYQGEKQFSHLDSSYCAGNPSGTNNSPFTLLIEAFMAGSQPRANFWVNVNGQRVMTQYAGGNHHGSKQLGGTFVVPPYQTWQAASVEYDSNVCVNIYH